jgi:hypothetical protein
MSLVETRAMGGLPLATMLSRTLVALTIELDDELEMRMPHVTSSSLKQGKPAAGPWLTSVVMWANLLRLVPPDGAELSEVERAGRLTAPLLKTMVGGLRRWGYLNVAGGRAWPTSAGVAAQQHWPVAVQRVEARWRTRLAADGLARALTAVGGSLDEPLPYYLPMLRHQTGFRAEIGDGGLTDDEEPPLVTLLSRVLLGFTLDVEASSELSLAIGAGVLGCVGDGVPLRDLPARSGVARETVTYAVGHLEKHDLVEVVLDGKAKIVAPTERGRDVLGAQRVIVDEVERAWESRPGVADLRAALEPITEEQLLAGVVPSPPGTWRATKKPMSTLPHHPMVTHRGGYPDGS